MSCDKTSDGDEREGGFTLIEILVVIIIIGILAAVAIPIYLNQQRTARDSATISDVRNLVTNIETGLASDPEASRYQIFMTETSTTPLPASYTENRTLLWLEVGEAERIQISKTEGTVLALGAWGGEHTDKGGRYIVRGYNIDGQEYDTLSSSYTHDSTTGGQR